MCCIDRLANPGRGAGVLDSEDYLRSTKITPVEWQILRQVHVVALLAQPIISFGPITILLSHPAIQVMRCSCAIRHRFLPIRCVDWG